MCKKRKKIIEPFDLTRISDPHFVATLTKDELEMLESQIRDEIIEQVSKYGGHLSSNLGSISLTIALNRAFDFNEDKLLFDVGHQSYTYKILTGRKLEGLRTKDGVSGFQKRSESSYDHFEAGHSSTSLSAAQGMAIARDLNGEKYHVVALIGDASISNGLAFEALNDIAHRNNKVIIVLNDNEMSITPPTGALTKMFRRWKISPRYIKSKSRFKRLMFKSRVGYFFYRIAWYIKDWFARHLISHNIFEQMGLAYIGLVDGHNYKKLDKALQLAKKQQKSTIVHVKTTKGKGYKPAETDREGSWHGIAPFHVETGLLKNNHESLITWSKLYADIVEKIMEENKDVLLINPATLKGSELDEVFKKFPGRSIDVGIAEEHAVTLSSGLALSGKHPIISIYSTFLQRSFDQVVHDLARMNLATTILVDRAGLIGADGSTHQGIFDQAAFIGIPNVIIAMASTPELAKKLVYTSLNHKGGPFFIRYPRERISKISSNSLNGDAFEVGKWLIKEENRSEVALVSYGPHFEKIKEELYKENINITLINAVFQTPFDLDVIAKLNHYKKVIIIDPYATSYGFVNNLVATLNNNGFKGQIITRAIPRQNITHASVSDQYKITGLDIESLISLIKNSL
ncbi:MAG TPA: 1-deoxy-D-xylulose-5-phosphate synthase [Bacilli bacterium]|jgi:1-deoxy-D-xylulose-5-phosphate synthase|nr:1-deoxy-D-xylulose-5-phosphate synthase [Bacilli bacterium]